jgi:quinohemoprotein ethanol dehydrogenase
MDVDVVPRKTTPFGGLVVWDPVQRKAARTQDPSQPWGGNTLATTGCPCVDRTR